MASKQHCITRLIQAAGRALTDEEVRDIFERINRAALDLKNNRKPGGKSGLGQAVDVEILAAARIAADEKIQEAALQRVQKQLQIARLSARAADVNTITNAGIGHLDAIEKTITRDYTGRFNIES